MGKAILLTLLFLAYPFLIYQGLIAGQPWTAPALLAGVLGLRALRAPGKARLRAAGMAVLLSAGALLAGALATKLIPVGIHAFLAWLFGHTLRRAPSLVERMVRLQFPEFPPGVSHYCRQVTFAWTAFFVFNVATCSLLAVFGSDIAWVAYNGFGVLVLMSLMVMGEYLYRHRRFPNLYIPSPRDSLGAMIRNGRRVWQEIHNDA